MGAHKPRAAEAAKGGRSETRRPKTLVAEGYARRTNAHKSTQRKKTGTRALTPGLMARSTTKQRLPDETKTQKVEHDADTTLKSQST